MSKQPFWHGSFIRYFSKKWGIANLVVLALAILAGVMIGLPRHQAARASSPGDWPTFMMNNGRSGFNAAETIINSTTAPNLHMLWSRKLGVTSKISTQPIAANGLVYWGSWDGNEHAANPATGIDQWVTSLGQTTDCLGEHLGVLSTGTIATVTINGNPTTALFVGGGNNTLYALDANSGSIIWQTPIGFAPNSFLYSSPAVYNGSVYIGVSGAADCTHVQAQMVQVDAASGNVLNTFNVVPTGCTGGSVWSSPTIDESTGMLYLSTGEKAKCSQTEHTAEALIELNASNLSLVGYWAVPKAQQIADGDFGASPTLFQATIGGVLHNMVGLANKSGIYYAFDRTTLSPNGSVGPLWQTRLATAPGPSSSSSAWDGTYLYLAAGQAIINGVSCAGSLYALDPALGTPIWSDCLNFDARGGVTMVPGLIELGLGTTFYLFDATNGNQLFSFLDKAKKSNFLGPGSISNGVLYQANMDGNLYAFGP